ncbi:MAG: phytanoyl-CoA dioxygenase family protein [Nostoc sp. TH1S01]|nr:phytanoyl-CoA dioxygenase family protein [Nostoc sp. TH1S01]
MMNKINFLPTQSQLIKEFYEENGYVIVKNVIEQTHITAFLQELDKFKLIKKYYYFAHDNHKFEKLTIDQAGLLEHSILNPLDMPFQKRFGYAASKIIWSSSVSRLLASLTDRQKHIMWQSIFIEKSHGISPHQDHYYLDTDPPGNLVACWFALENIKEDAGSFFVVPQSHRGFLVTRDRKTPIFKDHDGYRYKVKELMETENCKMVPITPEKGSVILWHPFLIHGSFQNKNPRLSRKSLIAHFLPEGYTLLRTSQPKSTITSTNSDILLPKKSILRKMKESLIYIPYLLQQIL